MQQMIKLTERQKKILDFVSREIEVSVSDILLFLKKVGFETSRFSVVRDLNVLLQNNFLNKIGGGRSTKYKEVQKHPLHKYVDIDDYFKIPQEERSLASESFEFDIFKKLDKVLTREDLGKIDALNNEFRANIKKISATIKKLEIERFTIELSWKSSQIEGNTYSLLDTEDLIKNKVEAEGHKREEAIMILNHKKALDFINKNASYFKKISLKKLEELHKLTVGDLGIHFNIRKSSVGITGTNYKPLDNEYQIKEAIQEMITLINAAKHPTVKSFLTLALISYIQPFEDGNKRTARLLANALLIAHNYCPLSYRNVKESEYKKAILIFYESHNIDPLKRMFVEQFKFAVRNYFRA
ncbi:MAG: Fic family protein [Candidatus Nomurabacteria bacterium GW2011_GWB1_37_5]|uniref:Fic family protein n=1 Tax=Candidatus Nomurabacteria bacterium GW2011_GWB1_37_5 TaxID=1618742 RepID=A0A0G0GXX6_9BACT|nr:MAG: Fic family protein [Candidatus Nomurabacteria bacterium GW2011_GWB1_37_5]